MKRVGYTVIILLFIIFSLYDLNDTSTNTIDSRINEFIQYFNHDIEYKVGTVTEHVKTLICDDGSKFKFEYPGAQSSYETKEENDALGIHHMVGSLEMETPYDSGEKIIVFYIKGKDGLNYVKSRSPLSISDIYTNRSPSFPGTNRFGNLSPQEYFNSFENVIKNILLTETDLEILTLEEAVKAVTEIENQDFSDFLLKETECYEKYYHNPSDKIVYFPKIELMVAPFESKDEQTDVYDVENYCFVVSTNLSYYYKVYIDGRIEKCNKCIE